MTPRSAYATRIPAATPNRRCPPGRPPGRRRIRADRPGPGAEHGRRRRSRTGQAKPTVVLVHGAWADASSWSRVISRLQDDGYTVRAIPNPLRSLSGDAASVRAFLETLSGPIVLVGHSYGGAVITNAATGIRTSRRSSTSTPSPPTKARHQSELLGQDSALAVRPDDLVRLRSRHLPADPGHRPVPQEVGRLRVLRTRVEPRGEAHGVGHAASRALGGLGEVSGDPRLADDPVLVPHRLGGQDHPGQRPASHGRARGLHHHGVRAGHLGLMSDAGTVTRCIERAATGESWVLGTPDRRRHRQGAGPSRSGALSGPVARVQVIRARIGSAQPDSCAVGSLRDRMAVRVPCPICAEVPATRGSIPPLTCANAVDRLWPLKAVAPVRIRVGVPRSEGALTSGNPDRVRLLSTERYRLSRR